MEPLETRTRGFKHRINQFFRHDDASRIKEATEYVHSVMGDATLLVKYRLIKLAKDSSKDRTSAPLILDEKEVLNAIRAVQYRPPPASKKRKNDESTDEQQNKTKAVPTGKSSRAKKARTAEVTEKHDEDEDFAETSRALEDVASKERPEQDKYDAKKRERQAIHDAWLSDYREMTDECVSPVTFVERGKGLSLSHVFGLAAKQYVAAVLANVRYHFRSYVCKSLGSVLRSKICSIEGVTRFDDLTSSRARSWRTELGKAYDDVYYHRTDADMKTDTRLRLTVERHRSHLVPPLPRGKKSIDTDLDSKTRPFVYLGYMIRMTAFLEASGTRCGSLYSPVPLKTSFIPAHYTFDTSSLAHLLMTSERIQGFKAFFLNCVPGGYPLPGLTAKANLLASLERQRGAPVTAADEELFKDALWTYLAYFRNRRTRILNPLYRKWAGSSTSNGMLFAHSISTDGYSVTLSVTDKEVRGRNHVYRSAVSARPSSQSASLRERGSGRDKDGFYKLSTGRDGGIDVVKEELAKVGFDDPERFVGGDPGKNVLLLLSDGKNNVLRYTGAQRRHETCGGKHSLARKKATRHCHAMASPVPLKKMKKNDTGSSSSSSSFVVWRRGSADVLEAETRRRHLSAKTCDATRFKTFVAFREASRAVYDMTYRAACFRALRFQAWTRRATSIRQFAEQIKEKYGERRHQSTGEGTTPVVILYGDWGRRTNLKHQAPSPGIGLRRLLNSEEGIITVTVHESYTSSYCPKCDCPVSEGRGKHGLLKCEDHVHCGSYWSRDVVGALNIRAKGIHLWTSSTPHPLFGG